MAKTVMIFGAGASAPFFCPPLTSDTFTRAIQDEARWNSLLQRYAQKMGSTYCEVGLDSILCLIQRANNLTKDLNFEEIIELVDKYSSYAIGDSFHSHSKIGTPNKGQHDLLNFFKANGFLGYNPVARAEVPVHLRLIVTAIEKFSSKLKLRFFKVNEPLECVQYWPEVPFLFRQLIAETIERSDRKFRSPDYCELLAKQSAFISWQLQEGDLSICTFNYDDVLPHTIRKGQIPLETGFVSSRFESVRFLHARSVLAFPHGHASWTLDDHGIKSFPSISAANAWRLEHISDCGFDQTTFLVDAQRSYDFNTFLTTGQDKESSLDRNPYCAYYQTIARDLLYADTVIVVGYSFRDPHIDRMLLNYIDLNPKSNKILLIDRLEEDIDLIHEFMKTEGFLRRVLCKHGIKGVPVVGTNNHQYDYKYADELANTNRTGFGFLCPQIWIYKLGYKQFLSEWRSVVDTWQRFFSIRS